MRLLKTFLFISLFSFVYTFPEASFCYAHEEEHEEGFLLKDDELPKFGLSLKDIAPGSVADGIEVTGRVIPVDSRFVHVAPRFSGVIKEVRARAGDTIEASSPLAVIQNNQNLQTFVVSSAKKGTVLQRHATLGESVAETATLFVVADLTEVWAELAVYRKDVRNIKVGQKVRVTVPSSGAIEESTIFFAAPVTDEETQSTFARISLKNENGQFPPGAFITATIVFSEKDSPLTVDSKAIEIIKGKPTIFVRKGNSFEPHPIVTGRSDDLLTEILSGVEKGEQYAVGNTELLKQELGKEEEHSHDEESEHEGAHEEEGHGDESAHSEEGHIKLSPEIIKNANITIDKVEAQKLNVKLLLSGEVSPNADKVAHVTPRFPGIIREVKKKLGDIVEQGEELAIIESNQSVQPYEIRSPLKGMIIERHSTTGEFASGESPIFVVSDLSEVWVDLIVPEASAALIKPGQDVIITHAQENQKALLGKISFLSQVVDETTQSRFARAVVSNAERHLLPGAFLNGEVIIDDSTVPIAIKEEGTQKIEGKTVVFIEEEEGTFEKREVILGRSDGGYAEVLKGLKPGDRYISSNSFLLKAELGKSEAEHEH